jgi:hypothetical protein
MDTLFLLNPGFNDAALQEGEVYYCPSCATIEGVLHYYPHLREQLEIIYVDFPRPRRQIIELLGDAYQSCPVLVINTSKSPVSNYPLFKESKGYKFIDSTTDIMNYLATTYGIGLPHP